MIQAINLSILNVGAGDLKIQYAKDDEGERKRAAELIKDLLRKGYAIMVQAGADDKGPLYRRVHDFDPDTCEYLVMGGPDEQKSNWELADKGDAAEQPPKKNAGRKGKKLGPYKGRISERVPSSNPAVVVGRSAGGYNDHLPHKIAPGATKYDLQVMA